MVDPVAVPSPAAWDPLLRATSGKVGSEGRAVLPTQDPESL